MKSMKTIENINRKRVVVEAEYRVLPTKEQGVEFLKLLSEKIGMTVVHGPFAGEWAHQAMPEKYGAWEAYAIWAESGVHMYVWEKAPLVTFEIFTCKDFSIEDVEGLVQEYFEIKRIASVEVLSPLE